MGETKHTPGPWSTDPRLFSSTSCVSIYDANSNDIACVEKGYETGRGGWVELPAMENARLIAAAPDLLAALEDVRRSAIELRQALLITSDPEGTIKSFSQTIAATAHAAIAKATGADNG